jgi:hypothetical protein
MGDPGPPGPPGPTNPTITTDTLTYVHSSGNVTYAGANWNNCTNIKLDLFGTGGSTVATGIAPGIGGTFTGNFPVPATAGEDLLVASGTASVAGAVCNAVTIFTVT